MDVMIKSSFDYGTIDIETKSFLLECEEEIDFILQRSGYRIGQILIKVKERLPHGEFGKWIEAKWGWSDRTCQEMMNIARNFKSAQSADLFPRKIQSILAAPSTPETARTEAIEKAESGEFLTIKEAKRIISEHKTRIAELEARPEQIQTQIVYQEKIPDDYPTLVTERDTLVDEKGRLLSQIKKLKNSMRNDVKIAVDHRLSELDREIQHKNDHAEAIQRSIDALSPQLNLMESKAGNLTACKEMSKQIRHHLYEISILLGDYFSDYELPDSELSNLEYLANEMSKGAESFRIFLTGGNNELTA